jgi:hypothetical protein
MTSITSLFTTILRSTPNGSIAWRDQVARTYKQFTTNTLSEKKANILAAQLLNLTNSHQLFALNGVVSDVKDSTVSTHYYIVQVGTQYLCSNTDAGEYTFTDDPGDAWVNDTPEQAADLFLDDDSGVFEGACVTTIPREASKCQPRLAHPVTPAKPDVTYLSNQEMCLEHQGVGLRFDRKSEAFLGYRLYGQVTVEPLNPAGEYAPDSDDDTDITIGDILLRVDVPLLDSHVITSALYDSHAEQHPIALPEQYDVFATETLPLAFQQRAAVIAWCHVRYRESIVRAKVLIALAQLSETDCSQCLPAVLAQFERGHSMHVVALDNVLRQHQ